jgi:hypothetical protein
MEVLIPLTCFPDIRFLALLNSGYQIKIEVCDRYERQSLRNRYSICGSQGKLDLSIPVTLDASRMYASSRISYRESWARVHWRSITASYNNAPYFMYYADAVESLLFSGEVNLQTFNKNALELFCDACKLDVPTYTNDWHTALPEIQVDLRNWAEPKTLKQTDFTHYNQVFEEKTGFVEACSGLDLLFNYGPDAPEMLNRQLSLLQAQNFGLTKKLDQ